MASSRDYNPPVSRTAAVGTSLPPDAATRWPTAYNLLERFQAKADQILSATPLTHQQAVQDSNTRKWDRLDQAVKDFEAADDSGKRAWLKGRRKRLTISKTQATDDEGFTLVPHERRKKLNTEDRLISVKLESTEDAAPESDDSDPCSDSEFSDLVPIKLEEPEDDEFRNGEDYEFCTLMNRNALIKQARSDRRNARGAGRVGHQGHRPMREDRKAHGSRVRKEVIINAITTRLETDDTLSSEARQTLCDALDFYTQALLADDITPFQTRRQIKDARRLLKSKTLSQRELADLASSLLWSERRLKAKSVFGKGLAPTRDAAVAHGVLDTLFPVPLRDRRLESAKNRLVTKELSERSRRILSEKIRLSENRLLNSSSNVKVERI
ncbi:hypothetical protein HDU90_009128 [Geranomyces variabilis]|nr:hypothetical protein HDU90_009128 [Geranomyces variabilis]